VPKMSASLENATFIVPAEKGWYMAHVAEQTPNFSKGSGAQMVDLTWEIDDGGQFNGKRIPFHHVMISGTTGKGNPVNPASPAGLIETLNGLKAYWECASCGQSGNKNFLIEGKVAVCPFCGKQAGINFDSDEWVGLRARILVDKEKQQNSDEFRNVIKRVRPLE
jgi:hypothetical protein